MYLEKLGLVSGASSLATRWSPSSSRFAADETLT
jgi:hypothetical protein